MRQRLLTLFFEACKEVAAILAGCVAILILCALALRLCPPISAHYAITGLGWIAFFSFLLLLVRAWRNRHPVRSIIANSLSAACVSAAFFVLVPVTIERSVSVFLLEFMVDDAAHHYDGETLNTALVSNYLCRHYAVEKRMEEQQELGFIDKLPDHHYALTDRGVTVAKLLRPVGSAFGVPYRDFNQLNQRCTAAGDDATKP